MKKILVIDMLLIIILIVILWPFNLAYAEANISIQHIDIDKSIVPYCDIRAYTIAMDPNILIKLDQKQNFLDDDKYQLVIKKSLSRVSELLPKLFLDEIQIFYAVCLADSRIFFVNNRESCDLIGWFPLKGIRTLQLDDSEKNLIIWLIPKSVYEEELIEILKKWQSLELDKECIEKIIHTFLNIDLSNWESVIHENNFITTKAYIINDYGKHVMELIFFSNFAQIKLILYTEEEKLLPLKITPDGHYLNKKPLGLPFWPAIWPPKLEED